jgi:hypothetical protein
LIGISRNRIRRLGLICSVAYRDAYVTSDPPVPGSPDFYREQALDMLKRAEEAASEDMRATYLGLAEHWRRLAQQAEKPHW